MSKVFEDAFAELQADMISICLEFSGKTVEEIFVYGTMENRVTSFKVFFRIRGKMLRMNELNSVLKSHEKIDDHKDMQLGVLRIGVQDLLKMRELCKEYNMKMPTEIKIRYDVKKNSMDAQYRYEPVYSMSMDRSDNDVFDEWMAEMRAGG